MIAIRSYRSEDLAEIMRLFQETVRSVNCRDYTPQQIAVWAPEELDRERWHRRLSEHPSWIAAIGERIVGFTNLLEAGTVDLLFVHREHQRQGIASRLMDCLEAHASGAGMSRLFTEASVTARPFFESRGFVVVRAQTVERAGVLLPNFVMEKVLSPGDSCDSPP